MSTSYNIDSIATRGYVPEQIHDNMQKGQEQKNVAFLAEYQRVFEKKQKGINKTSKTENSGITDSAVKMDHERKKKEKRRQNNNNPEKNKKNCSGIDIQA